MKKVVVGLILGIMAVGAAIGVATCMACGTPDDDEFIPFDDDDDDDEREVPRQRGASFVCSFEGMSKQEVASVRENVTDDEALVDEIIEE